MHRVHICWLVLGSGALASLQGCAAVLGSTTAGVPAVSEPPGMDMYLGGPHVVTTAVITGLTPRSSGDRLQSANPISQTQTHAEAPRDHTGFHLGLGVGGGSSGLSCDGCGQLDRKTGLSGFLSLAHSVGKSTLVGIESTGWTKSEEGNTTRIYSLTAEVTRYLNETSGLFLSTGLGLVGYHQSAGASTASAHGFGFSGRLGIEVPVARRVALTPYLGFISTIGGPEVKLNGQGSGLNLNINNLQFGVALGVIR